MRREIQIINYILQAEGPQRLVQVTEACGLPKASAHRILHKLCENALLSKQGESFAVGPTLLRWMHAFPQKQAYIDLIHPYLMHLSELSGHTIHLVQREGNYAYYIDKIEARGAFSFKSRVGQRLELYSTSAGRALLCLLSAEEQEKYWAELEPVSFTGKTIADKEALRAELALCRERGYALEIEQNEDNVQCIGAAFHYGPLELAISISLTTLNSTEELIALKGVLLPTVAAVVANMEEPEISQKSANLVRELEEI